MEKPREELRKRITACKIGSAGFTTKDIRELQFLFVGLLEAILVVSRIAFDVQSLHVDCSYYGSSFKAQDGLVCKHLILKSAMRIVIPHAPSNQTIKPSLLELNIAREPTTIQRLRASPRSIAPASLELARFSRGGQFSLVIC